MGKLFAPKIPKPAANEIAAPLIASTSNAEALREQDAEARLRRRRAGAATNVLTSPTGIPSATKLGEIAA